MNLKEFEKLKIDDVVSSRFSEHEFYKIIDTNVVGDYPKVCLGVQIETNETKYIRIDSSNCQFWTIVGRMIE